MLSYSVRRAFIFIPFSIHLNCSSDSAISKEDASKKAGADGGTLLFGRGTGIHEHAKLFGITIEPEKEMVLTLVIRDMSERVLETIVSEADLNKPGKGIAFVLEVERVVGINHLIDKIKAKAAE